MGRRWHAWMSDSGRRFVALVVIFEFALALTSCGRLSRAATPRVSSEARGMGTVGGPADRTAKDAGTSADQQPPLRVVDLAIGSVVDCVVVEGGRVGCWDVNPGDTPLVPGGPAPSPYAPRVAEPIFGFPPAHPISIAVGHGIGSELVCTVLEDRTVGCWEFGISEPSRRPPPAHQVAGLTAIESLALLPHDSYAIGVDGTVWKWSEGGVDVYGNSHKPIAPARVKGLEHVRRLVGDSGTTCVLTKMGSVRCWGFNGLGDLGWDSPKQHSAVPRTVENLDHVVDIGMGSASNCALRDDGRVSCWGLVGFPVPHPHITIVQDPWFPAWQATWTPTPTRVPGIDSAVVYASGGGGDCVLRADHSAWCWRPGNHGPGPDALPPTEVPVKSAARIFGGSSGVCLIDTHEVISCFDFQEHRISPAISVDLEELRTRSSAERP